MTAKLISFLRKTAREQLELERIRQKLDSLHRRQEKLKMLSERLVVPASLL
jgi:hypothetical protein